MSGSQFVPAFQQTARPWPRLRPSRFLDRDLSETALRTPAPATFGQAELDATRQEGFADGHAAGLGEAAVSQAAAEAEALGRIAACLAAGQADIARVSDHSAATLARALLAAMRAVLPDLVERSALTEISAMLALILPGLSREARVRIEVPPAIADGIGAAVRRLAPEEHARIDVQGQPAMSPGDLRVRWASGQARRRPEHVWSDVMTTLERALVDPCLIEESQIGE